MRGLTIAFSSSRPSSATMRTCRRCKQSFDPAENHSSACRFHPLNYSGGEVAKGEYTINQTLPLKTPQFVLNQLTDTFWLQHTSSLLSCSHWIHESIISPRRSTQSCHWKARSHAILGLLWSRTIRCPWVLHRTTHYL